MASTTSGAKYRATLCDGPVPAEKDSFEVQMGMPESQDILYSSADVAGVCITYMESTCLAVHCLAVYWR